MLNDVLIDLDLKVWLTRESNKAINTNGRGLRIVIPYETKLILSMHSNNDNIYDGSSGV